VQEQAKDQGNLNWVWWAGGIFLLLAYWNYSDRDTRAAPANATAGMTSGQVLVYEDCMSNSRAYNLSGYTESSMCRSSALGLDSKLDCHVEWDGRANPTVCE
jgi:hypothetical protein